MADDKIGLLALAELRKHPERYRGDPGEPGKKGRPGIEGKAGDPGLTWRGAFAYGTTYQPGDVVEWEGSSYVALVVTARRPPDPDWDLLAAKGEAGAAGRGYIRGGGGSSGSALAVKDEGSSLTAAAASIDFAGAGVTATAVGNAVTVTIPGTTGDFIPQGGPLTQDLLTTGFVIKGADDGGGALGAYLTVGDASGDGGGNASLYGGVGAEGWTGAHLQLGGGDDDSNAAGEARLYGGNAAAGSDGDGADIYLVAGLKDGAGTDGAIEATGSAFTFNGSAVLTAATGQPLDADLTAIAALTTTAYGRSHLAEANAAAGRTLLGLGTAATTAATDYQPIDSDLTAIAALTTTAFGRAFLALADPADGTKYLDGTGAFSVPTGGLTQPQVMARMTGA